MCMGRTHAISAAAAWLGLAVAVGQPAGPAIGCAIVAAAGALTPDLDHPNSLIAHRLHIRWLCRIVAKVSGGHRHATHSALFVLLAWLAVVYAHVPLWVAHLAGWGPSVSAHRFSVVVAVAFATGVAAHIVGDCLTPEGCPILWPVPYRYSLHLFTTGTRRETVFAVLCMIGAVVALRGLGVIPPGPYDHPSSLWSQ